MNSHPALFLFTAIAAGLALAGTVYVVFLALVGLLSPPGRKKDAAPTTPRVRFVFLIPAHNEEHGIGPTLESVRSLNYPQGSVRTIVIADNCTDRTAAVVQQADFECWQRTDPQAPGKGKALRWALDQLPAGTFDAVAFVDADTRVDPEFLSAMELELKQGAMAVQAQYEFDLLDSSYFSLLTFASKRAENNLFWRPRGRFAGMGFIVGNGFCLSCEALNSVPWSAYSIVEDVEHSIQLALHGFRVRYAESARVVSRPTRRIADAAPQRLRWASGTFQVMAIYVPKLLRASLARAQARLAEMALALVLTSRFFLIYLLILASAGSLLLGASGAAQFLRAVVIFSFLLQAAYMLMIFAQIPQAWGSRLRVLVALPFYIGWMFLVHVSAAVGIRRNAWIRTAR